VISFVGAGPGAPDLLTIRGAQRLSEADIVVWAASLVPEAVLAYCRPDVVVHDSKTMTLEDVTAVYAAHPDASIVRLHSGDPSVYGAIGEQIDWCLTHDFPFEIVPGVTSMAAAAAALGQELTLPGVSQSVILTRLADRTRSSMSQHEDLSALAAHGVTMAIFLSAARPHELQAQLLAEGSRYTPETPAVIAFRVAWPDERIVRTTVGRLAASLAELAESATVLVLIGAALAPIANPTRSHVYSSSYAHTFRPAGHGNPSP
jgi:precorrin-4/cobalt-precorrin-4 C11-methyltransferase